MGADFDSDSVVCTEQRVGLMCLQYLTLLICTGPFRLPGVLIPAGLMPTEPVLPPHESELPWQRMISPLFFPHSILTLFPEKTRSRIWYLYMALLKIPILR